MPQHTGLERELEFFEKHRDEYLKLYPGLFLLIKGEETAGCYPTAEAAYEAGLSKFGLEPFLVKQVLEKEPVGYAPTFFMASASSGR